MPDFHTFLQKIRDTGSPGELLSVDSQGEIVASPSTVTIYQSTVTLTDSQIKSLPSTPIEIVPAPGEGVVLVFIRGMLVMDISTTYTNVQPNSVIFIGTDGVKASNLAQIGDGNLFDVGVGRWAGFFTPNAQNTSLAPGEISDYVGTSNAIWENKSFLVRAYNAYPGNLSGNFTGGNASNFLKITIWYGLFNVDA